MSTPKFDALVLKVRDWANKDAVVLPDSVITSALDYSADYCYRKLRIPPLEYTYTYPTITAGSVGETSLQAPPDLSEIIAVFRNGYPMSQTDLQPLRDPRTSGKESMYAWQGGNIILGKAAELNDVFEFHYYRRLFDLDATYVVNQNNIDIGNCTVASQGDAGAVEFPDLSGIYYTGNEVYNWLRDDNERVLLWGAFAHSLDYLSEDERAMKFFQKQEIAVNELNTEETRRKSRGSANIITPETSELM